MALASPSLDALSLATTVNVGVGVSPAPRQV